LAFLATATISVWAAFDRTAALNKYWLIIGAILLYFTFANWAVAGGTAAQKNQAWLLASLGSFIGVYLLVSHDWDAYPSKIGLITSAGRIIRSILPDFPLERYHPNVLAGAMAILFPYPVAITVIAWFERNRWQILLGVAFIFASTIGLLMSGARGAWIAILIAAVIVIWWRIVRYFVSGRRRSRAFFFGSMAVALVVVAVLAAAVPQIADTTLSSLPSLESGVKRADLYKNSLILINDYPFIGAGLDNFMMLYSTYALLLHVGFSTHAHNLFLDMTIQQGIFAVFIYMWMLLLMGEAVWRMAANRRKRKPVNTEASVADQPAARKSNKQGILLAASALSVLIFVVYGLVDDSVYGTRMVLLMFVPFSFAVPTLLKARTPTTKQQVRSVLVGLLVVLLIIAFTWRPVYSLFKSNLAAVRQSQAELAVYQWPDWPVQDAVRNEVDLSAAVEGFEKAIELNAGNASAHRRLGQIQLSQGDYSEAVRHLESAYAQAPWDNSTKQMLGEAYIVNGQVGAGASLWSLVDNDLDQLDIRAAWYRYTADDDLYEIVKATADSLDG
jgi:O-antigen ligase